MRVPNFGAEWHWFPEGILDIPFNTTSGILLLQSLNENFIGILDA